ncbi:DUF1592 domain-containing protein [Bremerella cremea]|uniref:DUF1592 domain-containing protein n=1 Tax=Bremerella cremea TaxID=1031537 RepID=A0A368KT85_9BACT|nr:DUF1592 domain-containing protein [Bremerella cremea]RCS52880.1 DUF1592 domain-containing protein [Bremerella cremea]
MLRYLRGRFVRVAPIWLLALACALAALPAKGADRAELASDYEGKIVPFLQTYCLDCHSSESPEAGLDLTKYRSLEEVTTVGRKKWSSVLDMLVNGSMPPEDADQPNAEELQLALSWTQSALASIDCSGSVQPGRETVRRLNRIEYENTIRDLVGIEYQATDTLPADDVGYGFDNIGDVLSTSPLLFEKFYEAAEEIASQAIVVDERSLIPRRDLPLGEFNLRSGKASGNRLTFASNNVGRFEVELEPGRYTLAVYAYASQSGDEPAKMSVQLGKKEKETFSVRNTSASEKPFEISTRLPRGKQIIEVAFLNDHYDPGNPDPNRRDRNLFINKIELIGPDHNIAALYPESHKQIIFVRPGEKGLDELQAAQQVIARFASKAFRRPVTNGEMERLMILYGLAKQDGLNFEGSIREVVVGILCSPHFLFKVEGGQVENEVYTLNDYELATRLSYFLWSTMPDDELLMHAWKGTLRQNLDAQVKRMLADPKAIALTKNFAGQWLEMRKLETVQPDRRKFRDFSSELAEDMRTETERFFQSIVEEDRSVLDLLAADYSFLNERLAKHYGIDGVYGDEFRKVPLADPNRGGILTQASVLTVTSNPTRTSPVKRGKWILDNVLGTPPPSPPANVPTLESQKKLTGSLRQRMKEHRENAACASCHARMDPIGFALENFDAIGKWRSKDEGFDIDASGELPSGTKFDGAGGLKKLLLDERKDEFVHNLIVKTMTYALGRGVEYYDECAIRQIQADMAQQGFHYSAMIHAIVHSEPFQKRGG